MQSVVESASLCETTNIKKANRIFMFTAIIGSITLDSVLSEELTCEIHPKKILPTCARVCVCVYIACIIISFYQSQCGNAFQSVE